MFKKKEKANDIVNIVSARVDEVVNRTLNHLNFSFEVMQERDEYKEAFANEKRKKEMLQIKERSLIKEVELLKTEISALKENNDKLHEYLKKDAEILQSINNALVKKGKMPRIQDLKLEKLNKVEDSTKEKIK